VADPVAWDRYKNLPAFVLGFHGCDAAVADKVIAGKAHLEPSNKPHDWLGSGAYFWEGSPHRAMEWAQALAAMPNARSSPRVVRRPAVIGAIIDLGFCCNLFDSAALDELRQAWELMQAAHQAAGQPIPDNRGSTPDKLGRFRDRAVVEFMHQLRATNGLPPYSTVRAAFPEGGDLYPGAGFTARSHIQLAVRDMACVKGYFRPL